MPELSEQQLEKLADNINKSVDKITEDLNKKASKQDIDTIEKSLNDVKDTLGELDLLNAKGEKIGLGVYLDTIQKHVDAIETELKDQLIEKAEKGGDFLKELKSLVSKPEFIQGVKAKSGLEYDIPMSNKAISTGSFTADTGTTALEQMNIPGVAKAPWKKNPLFAVTPKQFVGEKINAIRWTEENVKTNNAAGTQEGAQFPETNVTWKSYKEDFYKIGHYMTMSEESIEDSDYVNGQVNDTLLSGLNRKVERDMFTGSNDNDTIRGIINTASQRAKDFVKPAGMDPVQNPNIYDVFRASKLQVSLGNTSLTDQEGFMADYVIVSPQTLANMELTKDQNNNYVLPPFIDANGNMVSGMRILESKDIIVGKYLCGDFTKSKVYIKRNLTLRTSDNVASQFLSDELSIKASIRMAYVIKNVHEYAFVYGDINDAIAAISI